MQIDFSNCAGSLNYYVDWKLVDDQSGNSLYSTSGLKSDGTVFVHEMRTPKGERRLVAADYNAADGGLVARVFQLGSLRAPPRETFHSIGTIQAPSPTFSSARSR